MNPLPRFEIRKTRFRLRPRWYVVLVASNGEVLSTSELLNSKAAAYINASANVAASRAADFVDLT